jgi:hypothetical protein
MPWETFYDVAVHNVICRFVPDFEAMAEAVRALLASGGAVRAEHRDAQSDERG